MSDTNNDKPKSKNKDHLFKPGNKIWERRTKIGREAIFATPEAMWNAAVEYFEDCHKNPLKELVYIGGKRRVNYKMRAMTMTGLCLFLGVNTVYFNRFKKAKEEIILANEAGNALDLANAFCQVIEDIEQTVFTQKFEGAAAGFLNANIISRDLGLLDKKELDHKNNGKEFAPNQVTLFRLPDNGRPYVPPTSEDAPENQEGQQ